MEQSEVLGLAASGDKAAFESLIAQREGRLYGLAVALLGSPHDAADALQSAVLQAYRSLPRLRRPESFDAWLRQIVVNEARALLRRRQRESPGRTPEPAGDTAPDPRLSAIEQRCDIAAALAALPAETRLTLVLRFYEDLPLREVARLTRAPLGTVKSRLHYGLKQLQAMMLKDSDGERRASDDA